MPAPFRLHAPAAADYDEWCALYRGYAEFYRQPMDSAILQQAWQWIGSGQLHAAIARDSGGAAIGLAHWEFILRPLRGAPLAYLHDLFVSAGARNGGCGGALLAHVGAAAKQQGCQHVRWLTKADNATARRLYDKKAAAATDWVMYQQALGA